MYVYIVLVDQGFYMEPDIEILKCFDSYNLAKDYCLQFSKKNHLDCSIIRRKLRKKED